MNASLKKALCLLLAATMCATLVACGPTDDTDTTTTAAGDAVTTTTADSVATTTTAEVVTTTVEDATTTVEATTTTTVEDNTTTTIGGGTMSSVENNVPPTAEKVTTTSKYEATTTTKSMVTTTSNDTVATTTKDEVTTTTTQKVTPPTVPVKTFESRKTPIMGWSSWNAFGTGITENKLKEQIDLMVSLGLRDVGYEYFNIDDGYQNGRHKITGRLRENKSKFPSGMKAMADYAHSNGLKAGIYTDGGDNNCCWSGNNSASWGVDVGLYKHEIQDLYMYLGEGYYRDTYAQNNQKDPGIECWGFDFIKVDWCGGVNAKLDDKTQYTKIGNIISEIEGVYNKDKIFNICNWSYCGPWQLIADSWRISGDIDMSGKNFDSVMHPVDIMKNLSHLTTPGHVNDPDMLVVGKGLSHEEDKTHFALWCMFSAPLVLGTDLATLKDETLALITNEELIAINQDPACLCASYVGSIGSDVEVWLKPLGSADSSVKAIMLVNRSATKQTVTIDFEDYGYNGKVAMRDVFEKADLGADTSYTVTLASHQSSILKLTPTQNTFAANNTDDTVIRISNDAYLEPSNAVNDNRIDGVTAKYYVNHKNAILLDVRTAEEYSSGHLAGAINILYTSVITEAAKQLPDKDAHIICYCSAGKRSAQAVMTLAEMGYTNVYHLGYMDHYES